jgi:hypothetical protein
MKETLYLRSSGRRSPSFSFGFQQSTFFKFPGIPGSKIDIPSHQVLMA